MTTIVNSATPANDAGGSNFLIGAVVIVGFAILFIFFGIPVIRSMSSGQVNTPAPQIVVPNKIDVNVKQTK